ncbi:paired amphipathic helix protein Sin3-like 2 [Artemisia annua]|uniref:Paired amphipathic helix protein Sin3-like 2 n=1 Tax=Artemisia annua TaxID=35608 RepID=A0A2U1Q8X1_ARTAN|nr:paired amphipathic helix protein Sin3-like 2 [Artemisia annua]PWA94456.1 paired amphipathic helix protein Sin3-like 2 [Artemisia annua]
MASTSGAESIGQTQAPRGSGSGTKKITHVEALAYVHEVRNTFNENPEKYQMFLDVMKDLGESRIDTIGAIARVKELFKDHTNLLIGFYAFVPDSVIINVLKI